MKKVVLGTIMMITAMGMVACSSEDDTVSNVNTTQSQGETDSEQGTTGESEETTENAGGDTSNGYKVDELLNKTE